MKTGLVALFFLAGFCRNSIQAQCDINYSVTSFNLALDFQGEAFLTTASFYPTYVSSSSSDCNPPTGTLGIWENAGATIPYATSLPFPFNCNHVGNTYSVWVTLDDPAPGGQSSAIQFMVTITDDEDPFIITPSVSNPYTVDPNTCARVLTFQAFSADNCQSNLTESYTLSGATTGGPFPGFIANHAFNVGTTTITWSVSDGSNTVTATTTVIVNDNQAPAFVGGSTPADGSTTTVAANASCIGSLTVTDPFASDNCAVSSYTITFDYPVGAPPPFNVDVTIPATPGGTFTDNYPLGTTTVTYKITDSSGNMTTRTFTVLVTDQTAPVFAAAPSTVNVATVSCFAPVTLTASATDNCATPSLSFTVATVSGGPPPFTSGSGGDASGSYPVGVYTITFTATDNATPTPNTSTQVVTLTVTDNIPPVVTCPGAPFSAFVNSTSLQDSATVVAASLAISSSDNCAVTTYEISIDGGFNWYQTVYFNCSHIGTPQNVLYRVKDAGGNISNVCPITINVFDDVLPTAQCQPVSVNLPPAGTGTITTAQVNNGSTDNCGVLSVVAAPLSFTCANVGANTVTLTVTDVNGNVNTCTNIVTVVDANPPVPVCNSLTIPLDASGNASILDETMQTVNATGLPVAIPDFSGSPGVVTHTISVGTSDFISDVNISLDIDHTWVGDLIATLTSPSGTTITLFDRPGYSGTGFGCSADNLDVTFDDEAANSAAVFESTCTPAPPSQGTFQPLNLLSAFDGENMVGTWTLTVTDNASGDMGTIEAWSLKLSTNYQYQAGEGSTDNCQVSWTVSPSSFDCNDFGLNDYTLTVTDGSNTVTTTCFNAINIVDNIAPTAFCQPFTAYLDATGSVFVDGLDIDAGSTDNCDLTYQIRRLAPAPPSETVFQSDVQFTCLSMLPTNVKPVVLQVTDLGGNMAVCTTSVTILDDIDPVAICNAVSVALGSNGMVTVPATSVSVGSTDNCFPFLPVTPLISADTNNDGNPDSPFASTFTFDCSYLAPDGMVDVAVQVTDLSGNMSTCETTITIQDNQDPTIICPPDLTLEWVTGMSLTPASIGSQVVIDPAVPGAFDGLADDNCTVTVTYNDSSPIYPVFPLTCETAGFVFKIQRTWTATDGEGNDVSCVQTITLEDTTDPTFSAPADALLNCPVSYSVANHLCNTWSNTVDVTISDVSTSTVTSTINVPVAGKITDINVVDLQVSHTWVGDLEIWLTSPSGTPVLLYDNSCGGTPNIDINFDDSGAAYGTFPCPPIDQNDYQPFQALSNFIGQQVNGNWTLTIIDNFAADGGALTNWGLKICYVTPGTDTNSGTVTNEADDCDPSLNATFLDYEAFKDFQSNTKNTTPASTTYNFSTGVWTYTEKVGGVPASHDGFLNLGGAPTSIAITSNNDGQNNTEANFSIQMPLTGNPGQYCIGFDWNYASTNTDAGYDVFGYFINSTFFQLTDGASCTASGSTSQSGRALVKLNPSDVFAFSQQSCDGIFGAATTTITNFVFIDKEICPVPAFDCPREFCIARVWDLEDDCGNEAASQLQIIRTQDINPPTFGGFPTTMTVLAVGGICTPSVTLDLESFIHDGCSADDALTITNNALSLYGKGDGVADASGLYAPGTYTITFTAEDECGNIGTHVLTLTVIDDQDPFAVCFNTINVQLDNTGNASITYVNIDNGSSDNCGIVNYSLSQSAFTTADIGQVPVVLTVTDAGGNQNTCTTIVNVLGGLTFDVGDASGVTGSMQNATVNVIDFTNITSFTLDLDITNLAVATLASPNSIININPILTANGTFSANQATAQVSWFASNPAGLTLADNTPIFDVKLMLVGSSGQSTSLVVTNDDATQNVGGNPLVPVTTLGLAGTISIISNLPPVTVSGTLQLESIAPCSSQGIGQVTVSLSGSSSVPASPILNANGSYSFSVPSGGNPTVTPSKNVNWNNLGQVNIADVVAVNQHFLGITLLNSPYKRVAADANANGSIQIADVFAINQISITNAPPIGLANTSWRFIDGTTPLVTPALPNQVPSFSSSISFLNITTNQTANFIGVKTGDVNCSVNPANFGGDPVSDGSDVMPFFIENQAVAAGEEVTVIFKARDFINYIGYQTTLNFDSKALQFKSFEPLNLTNLSQANFNANAGEGMLAANWFNHEALDLPDGQELFQLKFTALQDIASLQGMLSASSDFIQAMALKGTGEVFGVELIFSGALATGDPSRVTNQFALLQNRPNPFGQETVIGFVLPEGSNATLTLTDASGRLLKIVEGNYPAGYNSVKVSRNELPASGVIFYRLETPKHSAVRKMAIVD